MRVARFALFEGLIALTTLLTTSMTAPASSPGFAIFESEESFRAATANLHEVTFDDIHYVTLDGVTIRNSFLLSFTSCDFHTCTPDPNNLQNGNIGAFLDPHGMIELPDGTHRITMDRQDGEGNTIALLVTDNAHVTTNVNWPPPADRRPLELDSPNGLQSVEVLATSNGPVVLYALRAFGFDGELLADVDFEGMPLDGVCILSLCSRFGGPRDWAQMAGIPGPIILPSPFLVDALTLTTPYTLEHGFCAYPTCRPSALNPWGNWVVAAHAATIAFPDGTRSAMLAVEGIGDNPFTVRVSGSSGASELVSGRGVPFGVAFVGLTSETDIAQIDVVEVGGTGGSLVLSSVLFGPAGHSPLPVAGPSLAAYVAVGLGGSAVLWVERVKLALLALLMPLFTRIRPDEVLGHDTRGRVYRYLLENPGDHFNRICRALGLGSGTVTYHLEVLEREGLVVSRTDRIYRRFYPRHTSPPPGSDTVPDLRARIAAAVRDHPGMTQKELAGVIGVPQSTVSYQLAYLKEKGRLRAERHGRNVKYFPLDPSRDKA